MNDIIKIGGDFGDDERLIHLVRLIPEFCERINRYIASKDTESKDTEDIAVFTILRTMMGIWSSDPKFADKYEDVIAKVKDKVRKSNSEYVDTDNLLKELDDAVSQYIVFRMDNPMIHTSDGLVQHLRKLNMITRLKIEDYEKKVNFKKEVEE